MKDKFDIPVGTKSLILSKLYYGVLTKRLESLEIDRYFSIMYFLQANNGCSQQCICNNLAIDKTAMVKVMNYLIKAGYIERNVNPEDRREHFITLTKKGQKRTEEIARSFQEIERDIFTNISKEERENFLSVLSRLSVNLRGLPSNELFFNYKKTSARGGKK